MFAAQFTNPDSNKAVICGRKDCKIKIFPPGTNLEYLHSVDPNQPGRGVCSECYSYYMAKTTTIRRNEAAVVHESISKAQRGVPLNSVQAIGGVPLPNVSAFLGQPGQHKPSSSHDGRPRPFIQLPGSQSVPGLLMPEFSAPAASGYTTNHAVYALVRDKKQKQAYAESAEGVTVECRLVHVTPGKTSKELVGNVFDAIPNVYVHIGAQELRDCLFRHLEPLWNNCSQGFPLHSTDLILRNKDWVQLQADRDVIAAPFFRKNRSGTMKFHRGKCTVFLQMPDKLYQSYMDWCEDRECEQVEAAKAAKAKARTSELANSANTAGTAQSAMGNRSQLQIENRPNDQMTTAAPKNMKRKLDHLFLTGTTNLGESNDLNTGPNISVTNPPEVGILGRGEDPAHKDASPLGHTNAASGVLSLPQTPPQKCTKLTTDDFTSPNKESLFSALRVQQRPSKREAREMLNMVSISVRACPVKHKTLEDNIHHPHPSDNLDWGRSKQLFLYINMSPTNQLVGGFKMAYLGTASEALFGQDTCICVKQIFVSKRKEVVNGAGQRVLVEQRVPVDNHAQVRDLTTEVSCFVWGRALLDLVYRFTNKMIAHLGNPPFAIPDMRFVEAAMAFEQGGENRVFLLEEVVAVKTEGHFRKYIHNASAVPLFHKDPNDINRAEFLAFTQHVQYWKTSKLAFVADYQGGDHLLTDPQIVTDVTLGMVFASGNLSEAHARFESDHKCNKYCRFFQLPTDHPDDFDHSEQTDRPSALERAHNPTTGPHQHDQYESRPREQSLRFPPAGNSIVGASTYDPANSALATAGNLPDRSISIDNDQHSPAPLIQHPPHRSFPVPALAPIIQYGFLSNLQP